MIVLSMVIVFYTVYTSQRAKLFFFQLVEHIVFTLYFGIYYPPDHRRNDVFLKTLTQVFLCYIFLVAPAHSKIKFSVVSMRISRAGILVI